MTSFENISQLPINSDQLQRSDLLETVDYQRYISARPLTMLSGATTCECLNAAAVDSTAVFTSPVDSSNQQDVEFVHCLEARTSVDSLTTDTTAAADDDDVSYDSLYHLIQSRLCSVADASRKRQLCSSLLILLRFYEVEYLAELDDLSSMEESMLSSFPLHLIDQYTKLVKDDVCFYSPDGYVLTKPRFLSNVVIVWNSASS